MNKKLTIEQTRDFVENYGRDEYGQLDIDRIMHFLLSFELLNPEKIDMYIENKCQGKTDEMV